MNQSRKILVAAVLGLGVAASALSATVLNASASVVAGGGDLTADRIAAVFASLPVAEVDPAIQAAAARSAKGDLFVAPACADQKWPQITSECLVGTEGGTPRQGRTITVGYQAGEATTVLIRVPAPQVASR